MTIKLTSYQQDTSTSKGKVQRKLHIAKVHKIKYSLYSLLLPTTVTKTLEKLFLMILSTLAVPDRHPVSICRYIPRPFPLFVPLFKSFSIRNRLRLQFESSSTFDFITLQQRKRWIQSNEAPTKQQKKSTVFFLTEKLIFLINNVDLILHDWKKRTRWL